MVANVFISLPTHDVLRYVGPGKLFRVGEMMAINGANECEEVGMSVNDAKLEVIEDLKGAKWT
jgi:hypothetical protein